MYEDAARSYQQTNYLTANPLKLVLMCYEGAITNLRLAREHYACGRYEAKGRHLQKALDILHEMNVSLDMKKGGEMAVNLRSLYTYMSQALIDADLKRNFIFFDKIIGMLEELEGEWRKISPGRSVHPPPLPNGIPVVPRPVTLAERAWSA